ncbi:MAG: patatin-like phospholipase family protein [Micavibrio sp.]
MSATPPKTTIALFNYGGGMRGLIPAHIMSKIEDTTGLRMAEMVDIFAGPSTGAILNAAMTLRHPDEPSQPKYRARHMVRFYEREGVRIFPPDSFREFRGLIHDFNNRTMKLNQLNSLFRHGHYDPTHLGAALRALYGDAKLRDSLRSLIIPAYNIERGQIEAVEEKGETGNSPVHTKNNIIDEGGHAVWLKNIKTGTPEGADRATPDVRLFDAVMASAAAPTYFPCHHFSARYPGESNNTYFSGIDGSIFDNPCISYLGAIRQHVPADHKLTMIVLGTGYTNKSIKKEDWNRYGALGVVDPVNDLPLINILFNASESALMDAFEDEMGKNLFVFNKSLYSTDRSIAPSPQIDDASPETLKRLRFFVEAMMEEKKDRFDEVCHLLASNRDRRVEENREKTRKARARRFFSFFAGKDDFVRFEDRVPPGKD